MYGAEHARHRPSTRWRPRDCGRHRPRYLGETYVFAHATIEPPFARLLLRAIWQCSAVAWVVGGVLLVALPSLDETGTRRWVILAFVVIYGAGIVGNAVATRGRHFGWMLLSGVVALALMGL